MSWLKPFPEHDENLHESISPEIILALDLEDRKQIHHVLNRTENRLKWVKVGLQSYLRMVHPSLTNSLILVKSFS